MLDARSLVTVGLTIALIVGALTGCSVINSSSVVINPDFEEPVVLSSEDGVLDVTLTAHQDTIALNTVAQPVINALVYAYRVNSGSASDGRIQNDSNYPGPTLQVQPGDRLVVRMQNNLTGLTIRDFLDPATIRTGQPIPAYPKPLESSPVNLHTHGLHVSPRGNSDNVLLDIPAGGANTFSYQIPASHPQGLYWYHPHRHMVTDGQVDSGLAGMLIVGRADGNLPQVTQNELPVRTMALQNNFVFNRRGGGNLLNRPDWPQYGSTLIPPKDGELANGAYQPSLAPINFNDSPAGTTFATSWFSGPLSPKDKRGNFQVVPQNLQSFKANDDPTNDQPADPGLPDEQRDVQFTVNGQFQPTIASKAGQTEIWVMANVTSHAFMNVAVRETATGKLTKIRVVGVDGDPTPNVITPQTNGGETLLIPPAQRYAIAVTMPASGGLQLEMPPVQGTQARYTQPISLPGVRYTSNGTGNPTAVLGNISMKLSDISWNDGFLTFPTQKLLTAEVTEAGGTTVNFTPGMKLAGSGDFVDTSNMKVDVNRTFTITGAFDNALANDEYKRSFFYNFDNYTWPNGPLIQPRLGSVEQWKFISAHHDQHPTHVHVNDFQVMSTETPVEGKRTGVQNWEQDTFQIPGLLPGVGNPDGYGGNTFGKTTVNGSATIRSKFSDYTGTYVLHCHRLNHEDNGLMMTVNVLPQRSIYAVAQPQPDNGSIVRIFDQAGNRQIASVDASELGSSPSVAIGDVNGDQVSDIVLGASPGSLPRVVAFSGAVSQDGKQFTDEIARFNAAASNFTGGINVTVADIDGNPAAGNIVAAQGRGGDGVVRIYTSNLPTVGSTPHIYSAFEPYDGNDSTGHTGVVLSSGLIDSMSGRQSIVTAPGPGQPAWIKTFRTNLFSKSPELANAAHALPHLDSSTGVAPVRTWDSPDGAEPSWQETASFVAFPNSYLDGVNLATGWVAGQLGGVQRIIASTRDGSGRVAVFSSGSGLAGQPDAYVKNPNDHSSTVTFAPMANLKLGSSATAVSTTSGADLLTVNGGPVNWTLRRYSLDRPKPTSRRVVPRLVADVRVPGRGQPTVAGS